MSGRTIDYSCVYFRLCQILRSSRPLLIRSLARCFEWLYQ